MASSSSTTCFLAFPILAFVSADDVGGKGRAGVSGCDKEHSQSLLSYPKGKNPKPWGVTLVVLVPGMSRAR